MAIDALLSVGAADAFVAAGAGEDAWSAALGSSFVIEAARNAKGKDARSALSPSSEWRADCPRGEPSCCASPERRGSPSAAVEPPGFVAEPGSDSSTFPSASWHLFPDTGHMPQIERPEEFAQLVRPLLTRDAAAGLS